MRRIVKTRTRVREMTKDSRNVYRGRLSEQYDGIGQYVAVTLAGSSVGSAYKARVGSGDFGSGQTMPKGTPVSVFSRNGKLEILTMGAK